MKIEQWEVAKEFAGMGQFNNDRAFHFKPFYLEGGFGRVLLDAYIVQQNNLSFPWGLNIWADEVDRDDPESFVLLKSRFKFSKSGIKFFDHSVSNQTLYEYFNSRDGNFLSYVKNILSDEDNADRRELAQAITQSRIFWRSR